MPIDADESILLSDLVRTGEASRLRRRGALRIETPRRKGSDGEHKFVLFCGVELWQETKAYIPSVIPWTEPQSRPSRRSTGCGAVIHMKAAPNAKLGVWTAKTQSSDAVVPLDPLYFDCKTIRSSCGCIREGVGCAVCGNPLGTRYRPCTTAADGLFISRFRSNPLPTRPNGPCYWRPISHSPFIYTFFPTAVTSSPPHTLASVQEDPVFDRFMTVSPTPLEGDDEPQQSGDRIYSQPNITFDPDGEQLEFDDPNKSNEMLPER